MPSLVKDLKIVQDDWQLLETIPDYVPERAIVPLDQLESTQASAVWVDGDYEVEDLEPLLDRLDLIAVYIPGFADGRALSFATLLRKRYGFKGELRAIGEVLPDLTPFMYRSGFDSFVLENDKDADTAIQCIQSMTGFYQGSVIESDPAYRRLRRE